MRAIANKKSLLIASLVLGLWTIVVLVFLGHWGHSTKPKRDELSTLFSYPNGSVCQQPCVLGIRPSVTSISKAMELIETHPYTAGNKIFKVHDNGRDYLRVGLGENSLWVEVDYMTDSVVKVSLRSKGVNGVGFTGIVLDGKPTTWADVISYLGQPSKITASAGDGGMIFLAVGLYEEGWCIHASPANSWYPLSIRSDEAVILIEVNCYFYQRWVNGDL